MSVQLRWFSIGVLTLISVTWKLWTPQDVFPQIPLLRAACHCPGWVDWVCLAMLVVSAVLMLVKPRAGPFRRVAAATMALALAGLFVLDQHRLQPWAWQFFLLSVLFAFSDDITARRGWQWLAIGIYFWSAVSKFDPSFFQEQGPALLEGLKNGVGLRGIPNQWTEALDIASSIGIAVGELCIALLLAWPRGRWLGLWGATLIHITLLVALGPWGLNHSWGVLFWNVFFIGQDWLLFGDSMRTRLPAFESVWAEFQAWQRSLCETPASPLHQAGLLVITAALFWPSLAPFGYCDHWLAWRMYSVQNRPGHVIFEGRLLELNRERISQFRTTVMVRHFGGDYKFYEELEIDGWSLATLGAPSYPSQRFTVAISCWLDSEHQFGDWLLRFDPSRRLFRSPQATGVSAYDTPEERHQLAETFLFNCRFRTTTSRVQSKHEAKTPHTTEDYPGE